MKPESLALSYISNSTILNFVLQLGVNLDIFFRMLWRHVFTVEILKAHFHINSEREQVSFLEKLKNIFRDNKHAKALDYLERWGKTYWQETEYRIKEVTTKFEDSLKSSIGTSLNPAKFSLEGAQTLSEEQKQEIIHRAQHVVNEVQIKELSEVIELLAEVLEQSKKYYYIAIDRLDENWVEDRLRYLLIRALIETARDFRKARRVKIIIALRYDLIDRVFTLTRDPGFQEEKYESLFLHLQWNKQRLIEVLDSRINYLVQQRYTRQPVTHKDILPKKIGKQDTIDYMIDRTLMRPRDIILFFNNCIFLAVNTPRITTNMIKQAEGEYSRKRISSLADEWRADFPNLLKFAELLKGRKPHFPLEEITEAECVDFCLNYCVENNDFNDALSRSAYDVTDGNITPAAFRKILIQVFYLVSLVGLKLERYERTEWSFDGRRRVSDAEIRPDIRVYIHPCFWRTLGVREYDQE